MPFPQKLDAELELHPLEAHHAEALFAIVDRDRNYLHRWQNWPDSIRSLGDMRALVHRMLEKRDANDGIDLVIALAGQVVGKIGLVYIDWSHSRTEIGYWLAADAQGKGIMTRACRSITSYAFDELHLQTVNIRCAVGNLRSRAIPERLGFVNEGVLPFKPWLRGSQIEEVLFSMSAEHWRQISTAHLTHPPG
ncbi:MAG: GNAT family protein [bacterium]|nr:GNAT family protein [bacterium]